MTGRERLEAAFSEAGTDQFPAVIPYEGIYVRDHWSALTSCPWWHAASPRLEDQLAWRREVLPAIGQDWFLLPDLAPAAERAAVSIEERGDGVYLLDARTGDEKRLQEPIVGGSHIATGGGTGRGPATREEIDEKIPLPAEFDPAQVKTDGSGELAARLLEGPGAGLLPIRHVSSPLWHCLRTWDFEEAMAKVAEEPELVEYACRRLTRRALSAVRVSAALGAKAIWIEECLTDMIGPAAFEALNVPALREMVAAIREAGMKSIYYFTGDPTGKWEAILSVGADALALEESKKGFSVDVAELAARLEGRCVLFGNLDSIGVLQDGSEAELRAEISRQLEAGRRSRGRFVMSLGSPVTPSTGPERVRLYGRLVRELS